MTLIRGDRIVFAEHIDRVWLTETFFLRCRCALAGHIMRVVAALVRRQLDPEFMMFCQDADASVRNPVLYRDADL